MTKAERRRIIALYQQGWETHEIAQQFEASPAGVRRFWQQFREERRDSPAYANCGRRHTLDEAGKQQLLPIAQQRPDAFCHELAQEVEQKMGVRVSRQTIGRWLAQLGITREKVGSCQRAGASGCKGAAPAVDGQAHRGLPRRLLSRAVPR